MFYQENILHENVTVDDNTSSTLKMYPKIFRQNYIFTEKYSM